MLAYLFWHRPGTGVDAGAYEEAQRGFHARIESASACFHVAPRSGSARWSSVPRPRLCVAAGGPRRRRVA